MATYSEYSSAPYGGPTPIAPTGPPPPTHVPMYASNGTDGSIPAPATAGDSKMNEGRPWRYFIGGLILGFLAGIVGLIPLCVFRELTQNGRNRKYYLWGVVPMVLLNIILAIILVVVYKVNAISAIL